MYSFFSVWKLLFLRLCRDKRCSCELQSEPDATGRSVEIISLKSRNTTVKMPKQRRCNTKKNNKPHNNNEHLATKTETVWGTRCSQITTLQLRGGRSMSCVKREENLQSRSFFQLKLFWLFFFSIRLQFLRSRMKFPAAVTSTTSSWQENLNFWKDGLQLRDFRFIYRRYLDAGRENRSSDKSTWWVNSWHCSLTANRFWCRSFSLWSSVFWLGYSSL